ncbi:anti-sigma factor [Streptomyces sp. NPDC086182]|jgi:anti-sigma-K factor RskA|uniref:anti-sigma factor n=1 Tax=Streptomyces sp. NPDC086182 TaxID=3155058 RepID=UPI00342A5B33
MTAAEDPHELVGAYVLHALPAAEEASFENHLAGCAACRDEVAELSEVTLRLASAEEADPSPELRRRVIDRIAHTRQEHLPRERPRRIPVRQRALRVALAACLALAAALGGLATWQHTQADEARAEVAARKAEASTLTDILTARDATISTRKLGGGADISVVASRAQGRAAFIASDLPRLGDDQVYELWYAEKAGGLRPAGLLPGSGGGHAQLLKGSLDDVSAVGITAEPAGGSQQPTSEPLGIVTVPA